MNTFQSSLAAALLVTSGLASATIITFEESAQVSGALPTTQGDVVSSGFLFDSATDHTHFLNNYSSGDSGSTFLGTDDFAGITDLIMSVDGGGIFSLFSLDLGNWFQRSSTLSITGFFDGGGSVATLIHLGNFATYDLDWTNLTSVVFDSTAGSGDQYWGVDNLVVSTSVPEPSSILLLGFGLLGLCVKGLRKQNAA